ncbi:BTB/POZ and MATH domain-containing protein 2 [Rhynchospora pubera]|uniref:BTB/POZ and MATH domain-containing protein 2 n=1 Tax=Rhynchospora pubera TaxID=906938 RepID=A0AAV8BPG9_9POAL|nr:BTB/POZ and MATH domain-containing protein 2 [Rhynchospora pubera]
MGTSIEGVFTVEVKKLSELAAKFQSNLELSNLKSFERMYYAMYGPFTLGDIKFEIRMYPVGPYLEYHLCLLSDLEFVKKFGSSCQYFNPQSNQWNNCSIVISEKEFKSDTIGEGMGIPMVRLQQFTMSHWKQYSKEDSLLFKANLKFTLDDSKKVPSKPEKPEQAVPHQDVKPPKVCSCDLINTLLSGEFADIQFVVDSQTFAAHRAVLAARSSVFRSEFLALQREMGQNCVFISIQHVDALTFKYLLHFVYTNSLTPDFDELPTSLERYHRLFIAAHFFKIEGLKLTCEEKLTAAVTKYILSTLDLINFQVPELMKIVQKDCNIKPEVITTTTKLGDQLYGTSISKEHV